MKNKNMKNWVYSITSVICTIVFLLLCNSMQADTVSATEPVSTVEIKEGVNYTIPLSETVKLEMIWIKPGTFTMGSPKNELGRIDDETQHDVTLTKGFWLGQYEVTQAQYKVVMGENPSNFKGADLPVEKVSWNAVSNFCARLTEIERKTKRLPEGYEYTLPTEAQWEYACRAGTTTAFNNETNIPTEGQIENEPCPNLDEVGWCWCNSNKQTHPVGQKKPNAWGLYDMHGNVWEWCLDWYGNYPTESVTDPIGKSKGVEKVFRGGSWIYGANYSRSAFRGNFRPINYGSTIGFRLALSVTSQRGENVFESGKNDSGLVIGKEAAAKILLMKKIHERERNK